MPSGAEITVPMACERPSAGMQSTVLLGAGQGPATWLPSRTVSAETVLDPLTWMRESLETIWPSLSGISGATS